VLLRLIGKWLNAGVLEEGVITHPDQGTPQGGVISPLLANIYLHEVLDVWFEQEVKPRLNGRAELVRYADDFVICFKREDDARRVLNVLPKRFGKYGLTLHPTKTRLIRFLRPRLRDADGDAGTFELLGFTHYWGESRRGGKVVKRKTSASRLSRALKKVAEWCRLNRHRPLEEQHRVLTQKMRGHYSYFGITCNSPALAAFALGVENRWHKWLSRRSQKGMSMEKFRRILKKLPLPKPRVIHSAYRLAANP
jgi:hypothetical protein